MLKIKDSLGFDDVMLEPKYSDINSRSEVDLSVKLPKGFSVKYPLVPSNMKTIMSYDLAKKSIESGGLTILHRFMSLDEQIGLAKNLIENIPGALKYLGISVGAKSEDKDAVDRFIQEGIRIICIDIAHGFSNMCVNMCQYISHLYPEVLLIAGNVATGKAAEMLWGAGADIVKVNVGSGSICSTRIETGNGVPTITSLVEVNDARDNLLNSGFKSTQDKFKGRELMIMNDGGVKNPGDCVKALAVGANLLMCGNIFAGCEEAPGEVIEVSGALYKRYDGSSTHKDTHIEGVKSTVPIKGKFQDILQRFKDGISSGYSYQGARNLVELQKDPQFVKITQAGLIESHPHDVKVIK